MAESKIQKLFVREWKTGSAISVNAGSRANISVDIAKTGYIPIGILGLGFTGSRTAFADLCSFVVAGNNTTVGVHNTDSQANSWGVQVLILYEKN